MIKEIAEHVGVDVLSNLGMPKEQRREKGKWGAVFGVFALIAIAAFFVQKNSMKDADLLGGRETIEKFMHSNVAAMALLLLAAIGFIILCFKTWKGRAGSIYQLIYTISAGVIIVFAGVSIFKSIHNIQDDLSGPKTVTVENYVLCSAGRYYYVVFDEAGTADGILLAIPREKYNELKNGKASTKGYLKSRAWRLIEDSQYVEYKDAQFYETPLEVSYFTHSVIYDDCTFK